MKFLSKIALMFLSIGIFFVLAVILGVAYSQANSNRSRVEEELSLAQLRLANSPSPQQLSLQLEDLENKLTEVEIQLSDTRSHLDQSIESIEAVDTLYKVAEPYHVEITEISSPTLSSRTPEGVACTVLLLSVNIEGEVSDIIGYVRKLSIEFPTGVVESVVINVPEMLEPIGDKFVNVGGLLEFTIPASDPEGDPLTYSAANLPTGATLNSQTHKFSWAPTSDQVGEYPGVHFEVSDGIYSDYEDITIVVFSTNQPPVLEPISDSLISEGEAEEGAEEELEKPSASLLLIIHTYEGG